MRRVLALLTQLNKAKEFLLEDTIYGTRFAVVLLDNFVEVQILEMLNNKFSTDNWMQFTRAKAGLEDIKKDYSITEQQKILTHCDEAIKAAAKLEIITQVQKELLLFAHNVRNAVYHAYHEEEALVNAAAYILYSIIITEQPKWGNGKGCTSYYSSDPVLKGFEKFGLRSSVFDWMRDWDGFIDSFFRIQKWDSFNVPKTLSDFLISIIDIGIEHIDFVGALNNEGCNYDETLRDYSFEVFQDAKIREIFENDNLSFEERVSQTSDLYDQYCKKWKPQQACMIHRLKKRAEDLAKEHSLLKTVQKYTSLKVDVDLICKSYASLVSDIETKIDLAIDIARGK